MSKCPKCESIEVEAQSPRTVYECGSSDYDQRPNTFVQSEQCKLNPEQQPPSESEREKIENVVKEIVDRGFGFYEAMQGDHITDPITDFILEREKEKDAEIEKTYTKGKNEGFQEADHQLWLENSKLKAENERLKGEREKDAIGLADFLLSDYEMDNRGDELVWRLCGTEQKITTNEAYTEYLKSNNK